jgi:hypothetical protein
MTWSNFFSRMTYVVRQCTVPRCINNTKWLICPFFPCCNHLISFLLPLTCGTHTSGSSSTFRLRAEAISSSGASSSTTPEQMRRRHPSSCPPPLTATTWRRRRPVEASSGCAAGGIEPRLGWWRSLWPEVGGAVVGSSSPEAGGELPWGQRAAGGVEIP